jgi:adenylate cyclase
LLKLKPGLTVQQWLNFAYGFSENPTFRNQIDRIGEGLRKAGLPED